MNVVGWGSVIKVPDYGCYFNGTVVELTAVADPGWTFTGWSGDISGSNNPEYITMNSDNIVTAIFEKINIPPIFLSEDPPKDSSNIDITQATVNVTIEDPNGDLIDWTIKGTYVNDASGSGEGNGSKQASLITPLTYNTNVVWFVNATDGMDNTEMVYYFTTRVQYIPGPPSGFTASAVSRTQIDLSWTKDGWADNTYVERYSMEDWSMGTGKVVYNGSGSTYSDTSMSGGTTFYYQAWSYNNSDNVYSTTFAEANTTLSNLAPNIPSSPLPESGATNISINADLSWTCSDPDGDSLTYDVYFGTTASPPKVSSNQSETSYDPGKMNDNTQYFWYIVAWDSYGAKTNGPVWSFTTETQIYFKLFPTDDSFTTNINAKNKNKNFGNLNFLISGMLGKNVEYYSWFKFDLNSISVDDINSAKFHLTTLISISLPFYESIFGAHFSENDNWNENDIKWKNQPDFNSDPEITVSNPKSFAYVEFDLTNIVYSELNGDGYLTVIIKSENNYPVNLLSLFSKENPDMIKSYLEIT